MRTHYQNLKVAENAPQQAVKSAYRKLCLKHHPDRNPGNPDSQRIMQILNDAYDVLSDPVKRRAYDQDLVLKRAREASGARHTSPASSSSRSSSHQSWPRSTYQAPPSRARRAYAPGPIPNWRSFYAHPAPRYGWQRFVQEAGISYGMLFVFFCLTGANLFYHFHDSNSMPWGSTSANNSPRERRSAYAPYRVYRSNPHYVRPETAPNGRPWPATTDYVDGYPVLLDEGDAQIELVNPPSLPDLFVKLVSLDANRPYVVRTLFVRGGSSVTLSTVSPGLFDLRFQNLKTGEIRKTGTFELRVSNLSKRVRASNRSFNFLELWANEKATFELSQANFDL